jgi:hypothetical protein
MATKQRIVYGASVEWGTDGSTWADVPECKGLAVPTIEIEYQDATHLESPGGFREYITGLKDAGAIEVPCGYSSAAYEDAHGYMSNGTLVYFQTTMPLETGQATGDVFAFTGYVVPKLETNAVGDIIGMMLAIRVTGQPTFTRGTDA